MARILREGLLARLKRAYPTAVIVFEEKFKACIAHLHSPVDSIGE
jgi:hypothetical protein